MGFTGRLGTGNSRLGNILLGVADALGYGVTDFRVHQIESNKIRVKYDTRVNLVSALQLPKYTLDIVSAPGPFVIPNIISVKTYDGSETAIVLLLDKNLTSGATYSLEIGEIFDIFGSSVSFVAQNFDANVVIPPLARGAFLSKRATVDVLFDKNVGLTSVAAVMTVEPSTGGPAVAMTQLPWIGEALPNNTLRFLLPAGMASADSYVINYSDVIDESQNVGAGIVPLTLNLRSPTPHTFASISQLQIIDAFVTDISNDLINTAAVRVYFNGPTADAGITGNWTVAVQAPHRDTDTINQVVAPDASNLPTLITLLNDIKSAFNAHIKEEQVHFQNDDRSRILTANASDLTTSLALANAIQIAYLAHLSRILIHAYPDTVNDFAVTIITGQPAAIILANTVKANFNAHVLPSYPLVFSTAYPSPIDSISSWSNYAAQRVFPTLNSYSSFADLHVVMKGPKNRLLLTATVTSEDTLSITNPGDDTGSIIARSLDDPNVVLSTLPLTNTGSDSFFDKEISVQRDTDILVTNTTSSIPVTIAVSSDEKTLAWNLNQLVFAYSLHIASSNGAVHLVNDTTNTVSGFDYVNTATLSELILKANAFKSKVNLHLSTVSFHFNPDSDIIRSQPASDINSLVRLIIDIRDTFLRHNIRDGVHDGVGARVVSAKLYDILGLRTNKTKDADTHTISGFIRGYYFDNQLAEARYSDYQISTTFIGSADRPSLASAVPKLGLVKTQEGLSYESDSVEFYFSKPMQEETLDASNIVVSGGSIFQKAALWVDSQVASVEVISMEEITYSATASDLTDLGDNLIY
jgi:hypothetical protein